MLTNILWLLGLIAVIVLFAWLTRRAWKSQRAWIKFPGVILLGLLSLGFALVTIVMGKGMYDLYRPYPVALVNVSIAGTTEQIARGEHLASVLCVGCHSQNGELPLVGGNDFSAETGLPLGEMYPPNITPAGKLNELTDADIFRILRSGVAPNGQLTAMSFFPLRSLSDEDALAVIAYLRQQKPVEGTRPPFNPSPLFAVFMGMGFMNIDAATAPIQSQSALAKAPNAEYGTYVAKFMSCTDCHGPTLSGDAPPPAPPGAPNITVIVPKWSKDDFFKAMRTGVDPEGHQIQSSMPWKLIGRLDDVELEALYEHLHGLTPVVKK
ncbi:MAG: c-type cytochrome [Chloroflexi bacterium]|nr:c-type cytochrome [Chloroflexota bacterium]